MNLTERSLTFEIFDAMELVNLPLKVYKDDHNDWFEIEFGEKERNILRQQPVNFRQLRTICPGGQDNQKVLDSIVG